jgi:hypothetical protein
MSEGSLRGPGLRVGPLLLAVVFLAVLGGGVGYSVGTLTKGNQSAGPGAGGGAGPTVTETGQAATPGGTASSAAPTRCKKHTEDRVGAGPLTQVLYLHTDKSEVWICKDANGTLYYQGHAGQPGEDLQEGVNALVLTDVKREGTDGYVATNRDANNGRVTEYHVTPTQLVKKFYNYASPQPDQTENAV